MRKLLQTGLGVAVALGLCVGAQAQPRGHQAVPVRVAAPDSTQVVRANRVASTFVSLSGISTGTVVLGGFGSGSVERLLQGNVGVPGLGFDYAHLAAVNRDLGVRALIDPVTQSQLALARQIRRETPIIPVVWPFLPSTTEVILVQPPPVVVVQQPAAAQEIVEPVRQAREVAPRETAELARPPEPRDVGEFILVRRDGRVVFAVAFSTAGVELTYITREGVRRSFPLAELDSEATRKMNEERGTALRLPS